MEKQRAPVETMRRTSISLCASTPNSSISHWVSFLLASIFLPCFWLEMSCLALKFKILSFAIFSSARFSNSSEWCITSLWHRAHWMWSCFSTPTVRVPKTWWWLCLITLCNRKMLIAFLCCRMGTKGCRGAEGGRHPSFHLAELPSAFIYKTT